MSGRCAVIRDQGKRKRRSFSDRLKGKAHRAAARAAVWVMVALWALGGVGLLLTDWPGAALPCAVVSVVALSAARRQALTCREHWRRYFEEEALAAEMSRRERWERNFVRARKGGVIETKLITGSGKADLADLTEASRRFLIVDLPGKGNPVARHEPFPPN